LYLDIQSKEQSNIEEERSVNLVHLNELYGTNYENASDEVKRILNLPPNSKFSKMMRGKPYFVYF
jgi:hypothetical protein